MRTATCARATTGERKKARNVAAGIPGTGTVPQNSIVVVSKLRASSVAHHSLAATDSCNC